MRSRPRTARPFWSTPASPRLRRRPRAASREDGLESFGRVLHLERENLAAGQLARIGLSPSMIKTLVITHGDIDHVGSLGKFPDATIVVGRAERALGPPRYLEDRRPIAWPEQTYQLVDDDTALCPGVTLLATPGHSPGHLSLLVRLQETGPVLLTGDAISRAGEPEEDFGGNASDPAQAATSACRLLEMAERERAMIVYGHDSDQWPNAPQGFGVLRREMKFAQTRRELKSRPTDGEVSRMVGCHAVAPSRAPVVRAPVGRNFSSAATPLPHPRRAATPIPPDLTTSIEARAEVAPGWWGVTDGGRHAVALSRALVVRAPVERNFSFAATSLPHPRRAATPIRSRRLGSGPVSARLDLDSG